MFFSPISFNFDFSIGAEVPLFLINKSQSIVENDDLKRYYSIGEVAEKFSVSRSLVRFWENEFEVLRPYKSSKGERRFTKQNLEQFQMIYDLVKERGFTLKGAKKEIERVKHLQNDREEIIGRLVELKDFLEKLKTQLSPLSKEK